METINVSASEVEIIADEIHEFLVKRKTRTGPGVAGLSVVLGRLMAPREINSEEELKFMQDVIEWTGMYWSGLDQEGN